MSIIQELTLKSLYRIPCVRKSSSMCFFVILKSDSAILPALVCKARWLGFKECTSYDIGSYMKSQN